MHELARHDDTLSPTDHEDATKPMPPSPSKRSWPHAASSTPQTHGHLARSAPPDAAPHTYCLTGPARSAVRRPMWDWPDWQHEQETQGQGYPTSPHHKA